MVLVVRSPASAHPCTMLSFAVIQPSQYRLKPSGPWPGVDVIDVGCARADANQQRLQAHREEIMLRIFVPSIALVFGAALAQPAAAQSGVDLVKQAVAAQGGAAALGAAKTTVIKGEAKHWEPGQSYSPTGEARFLGDATYTQSV